MGPGLVRHLVELDPAGQRYLRAAYDHGYLSARGHQRILRVARTVADLDGAEQVRADHVLRALSLRVDAAHEAAA
jgi:magnesium chelatase family protein